MRVGTNRRAVQEQSLDFGKIAGHDQTHRVPVACFFPAAKALIDRIPVAKTGRKITPRNAGSRHIQDGFDEIAIRQLRWRRLLGALRRTEPWPRVATLDPTNLNERLP